MEGLSSYQPYAKPSWSYDPYPAPSVPDHLSSINGWMPNKGSPSGISPDPQLHYSHTNGANGNGYVSGSGNGNGIGNGDHSTPHTYNSIGTNALDDKSLIDGGIGKWKAEREAPVKNACLTCRGKKAKCDGIRPICSQCGKKGLECVYVKSRRGGARKKREVPPPSALQEFLKKLDGLLSVQDPSLSPGPSELGDDTTNIVRTFSSKEEIMSCYYNEVHPFLPVMPPRKWQAEILRALSPNSPFLLAAQTILVLVPHPKDANPKSQISKRLRTRASVELGDRTMAVVNEMLSSESSIECVQALCMLSLWEWGSSGNLSKNRSRAEQAVQVAMGIGMHEMDQYQSGMTVEGTDWKRDMARRTWWVVYVAQLTAAMISGNVPVVGPDDPRIKVDFPICNLEDRAWPNWVNTNRHCVRAFGLINSAYYGAPPPPGEDTGGIAWGSSPDGNLTELQIEESRKKIFQVDQEVMEFMKQAEATSIIDLVPGGEEEVVRNQQLSARLGLAVVHIHIHRQQAFPEVSLFSKRICGLPSAPEHTSPPAELSMPLLDNVAVPQALADGVVYSETPEYTALNDAMVNGQSMDTSSNSIDPRMLAKQEHDNKNDLEEFDMDGDFDFDFTHEMWQPETYPENLPAPWFAHSGGAASLYQPTLSAPHHVPIPPLTATIRDVTPSDIGAGYGNTEGRDRRESASSMRSNTPNLAVLKSGPHKAWGVDENSKIIPKAGVDQGLSQIFPPGISLARCATAAHTIVRLEVLHRSAVIAMWDGPPKWLPFCACGLVTGAYAFLLLALAVQAENNFGEYDDGRNEEVEALLTNVKVILAGLEAYGIMWGGIEVMANEVRAALEAAMRLPLAVRSQIESYHGSPPLSANGTGEGQNGNGNGNGSSTGTGNGHGGNTSSSALGLPSQ